MSDATVDAVVIGAGPNGLTAAAVLADAGWDVLVLEEQPEPGGAVRSAELHPGYCADLFSAFYPLGVASPAFQALDLASHGLRWARSPKPSATRSAPTTRTRSSSLRIRPTRRPTSSVAASVMGKRGLRCSTSGSRYAARCSNCSSARSRPSGVPWTCCAR